MSGFAFACAANAAEGGNVRFSVSRFSTESPRFSLLMFGEITSAFFSTLAKRESFFVSNEVDD